MLRLKVKMPLHFIRKNQFNQGCEIYSNSELKYTSLLNEVTTI